MSLALGRGGVRFLDLLGGETDLVDVAGGEDLALEEMEMARGLVAVEVLGLDTGAGLGEGVARARMTPGT